MLGNKKRRRDLEEEARALRVMLAEKEAALAEKERALASQKKEASDILKEQLINMKWEVYVLESESKKLLGLVEEVMSKLSEAIEKADA